MLNITNHKSQIRNLRDESHRRRNTSSRDRFSLKQRASINQSDEKTLQVPSGITQTNNGTIQNPTVNGQDRATCLNLVKNSSLINSYFSETRFQHKF